MSLRPEIWAFRLDRMRSLFGSGDRTALRSLKAKFVKVTPDDRDDDNEYHDTFHAALDRAITAGVPFDGLDAEGFAHVQLAVLLAGYKQKLVRTTSNLSSVRALQHFGDTHPGALGPEAGPLFAYLLHGRPLFGRRIVTSWSYYGYLTAAEVVTLRAALAVVSPADKFGEEMIADIAGWLDRVARGGHDLWFWTE